MSELINKNVLISGISRGIGKALAIELAREGCNVFGIARDKSKLDELKSELNKLGVESELFSADVGDYYLLKEIIESLISKYKIDVLINNAGIGIFKPLTDYTYEDFDRLMKTNLYGVFNLTHLVLPSMIQNQSGDIIFISSLAGKNVNPGSTGYSATKFALTGFAHSLMLEVRKYNIRICLVHPGSVDTELIANFNPSVNRERILKPIDVVEPIITFLKLPGRAMMSEFEIRPTNP